LYEKGSFFFRPDCVANRVLPCARPGVFARNSSRLRLGSRFAYTVNEHVSPYIGAAYEHEFDGRARATTYGYSIDAPSMRGSTGIGELGLSLRPSMNMPLSFDLGVQGYTGKREGVTGSLQIKLTF